MLISSNCGVLFPNIRKTNTFSHFDVKLLLKHCMYSHIKQHILHTLHTDPHFYTETRPHTHIPVVSPAPNALTSSLYPPSLLLLLQSLSVSSDRRRRTPPRTALQEREGEKRAEIERERERETELEKAWTLYSFQPCTRKWVSDSTQKRLFICLLCPLSFSHLPFSALLSPFSPSPALSLLSPL